MQSGPSDLAAPPFLDHLAKESGRVRAVLADAPPGVPVPTCPDWDADDLLWHLAEVQWFWGEIAAGGLTTRAEVDALDGRRVHRPPDRAGLLEHFDRSSSRLHDALGGSVTIATVDAMHAWTVTPVRITGSSEGQEIDVRRLLVADGPDDGSAAEICGSAADLDCWLWNRPAVDEITREGDAAALAAVEAVLTDSID